MSRTAVPSAGVLVEMAMWAHELYLSFVKAGFDPDQALYLTGEIVTTSVEDEAKE